MENGEWRIEIGDWRLEMERGWEGGVGRFDESADSLSYVPGFLMPQTRWIAGRQFALSSLLCYNNL
jgi:hypothetical protein